MAATDRLSKFLSWRGWTRAELAEACSEVIRRRAKGTPETLCSPAMVSQILLGKKRPGLDIAHAIEAVTQQKRDDGELWPGGAVRTEEWPVLVKENAA